MIDYCKQILGKSIRDLTIEDLKEYFSEPKEETEILEFKSGRADFETTFNKNILRAVCAFLNSSGGVLIWGAPEDKAPEKRMPKMCIGDLVTVKERKEKDQLINRISSSISYMPTGIKVERLDYENGYVYIIEVQESESKPHQLSGQYLIRLDGQTIPAPHYIVDSMFNQVKFPDLDGRINFIEFRAENNSILLDLSVLIFNKSPVLNEKYFSLQLQSSAGYFKKSNDSEYRSELYQVVHYGRPIVQPLTLILDRIDPTEDFPLIIKLAFGGEIAPAKNSVYTINLKDLTLGRFNFKRYVTDFNENQKFFIDIQNFESSINKLLKRD